VHGVKYPQRTFKNSKGDQMTQIELFGFFLALIIIAFILAFLISFLDHKIHNLTHPLPKGEQIKALGFSIEYLGENKNSLYERNINRLFGPVVFYPDRWGIFSKSGAQLAIFEKIYHENLYTNVLFYPDCPENLKTFIVQNYKHF
jgi:hypothetical protein